MPRPAALIRPHLQSVGSPPRTRWTAYATTLPRFRIRPIGLDQHGLLDGVDVSSLFFSLLHSLRKFEVRNSSIRRRIPSAKKMRSFSTTRSMSRNFLLAFLSPCSTLVLHSRSGILFYCFSQFYLGLIALTCCRPHLTATVRSSKNGVTGARYVARRGETRPPCNVIRWRSREPARSANRRAD